jgi:cell wall-associated NlpC family hydrolase
MDGQIRQLARTAYTTGDISRVDALLTSRSPGELVAQMGTLDAIAGHQTAVVKQVSDAAAAARAARASAQGAAAAAQRTLDQVGAEQAQLQAQIADYRRQYAALTAPQQQAVVQKVTGSPAPAAPAPAITAGASAPVAAPVVAAPAASGSAAAAVRTALAQVGKPYAWGAAGPNAFDCSGLMQYSWGAAGRALPHSSNAQSGMGTPVSRDALQPGDLVFFFSPVSHVAMYVGNGMIVHASTEGQPVKVVSLASLPGYNSARRLG